MITISAAPPWHSVCRVCPVGTQGAVGMRAGSSGGECIAAGQDRQASFALVLLTRLPRLQSAVCHEACRRAAALERTVQRMRSAGRRAAAARAAGATSTWRSAIPEDAFRSTCAPLCVQFLTLIVVGCAGIAASFSRHGDAARSRCPPIRWGSASHGLVCPSMRWVRSADYLLMDRQVTFFPGLKCLGDAPAGQDARRVARF